MFSKLGVIAVSVLLAVGCSNERATSASAIAKDGVNGYSVVSAYNESSDLECSNGGMRLDMYLDMDYSLSATEGDIYMNSLVSCNGTNGLNGRDGLAGTQGPQGIPGQPGPQGAAGAVGPTGLQGQAGLSGLPGPVGPQGPQGPQGLQGAAYNSATIRNYSSSSCTLMTGTTLYVKPTGSNNYAVYSSSSCSSNTKQFEISQGESYWVSTTSLAIHTSTSLRVITFN